MPPSRKGGILSRPARIAPNSSYRPGRALYFFPDVKGEREMTAVFRDGYTTVADRYEFTPVAGQFGAENELLEWSRFFGIGAEDAPLTKPFDLPLSLSVDVPFKGEVELFSARLFGDVSARFGLLASASITNGAPDPDDPDAAPTGSISAALPYDISYAYPALDPARDAGELFNVLFAEGFDPDDDSGFTTRFPTFTFTLELLADVGARLIADFGREGEDEEFTVLDFDVGTAIELVSLDNARRDADGEKDPLNVMGNTTTQEIIDDIEWLEPAFDREGELAGVEIPFNQFFSKPETKDKEKAETEDKKEKETGEKSQTKADDDDKSAEDQKKEEEENEPPDPAKLDLGGLQILVPQINVASKLVDGVFVTDPSKRVVDGEIVDDVDEDGFAQERGNRSDIVRLTVDVDGLVTYATGGTFPPMEYTFFGLDQSLGDVLSLSANLGYNLFDVELVAALPLVQEFTLTPELATRLSFFEVADDGAKGAAKPTEVVQIERVILFDENGTFRSEAVAERLRELAEGDLRVAQDVDAFVDFAAGIPGAFTGQTASIGGRVVVRDTATGDAPAGAWRELFTSGADPVARTAPALGEDQLQPLTVDGLDFGYKIFRDDDPAIEFEIVEFGFDEGDSIYRREIRETVAPLSVTPFLTAAEALALRYDGDDTFVEVEHRAQPTVTNRTGLDFDLSMVLSALELTADFEAKVDLGPIEIDGGIDLGFGPLWRETFPLFTAELVDFYNDSFQIFDSRVEAFTLGGTPPAPDFGDAIVGGDGPDDLAALPGGSTLVAFAGEDTLTGQGDDDTLVIGNGVKFIEGAGGFDTLDLGQIVTPLVTSEISSFFGQRVGPAYGVLTLAGLPDYGAHYVRPRDERTTQIDRAPDDIHIDGIERVVMTDAADNLFFLVEVTPPGFQVPELFEMRGGDDNATITVAYVPLEQRGLTLLAGAGDDTVELSVTDALTDDWSAFVIDGGPGTNTLKVDADFDLSAPTGAQGALGARVTNFQNLKAAANTASTPIPPEEGGGVTSTPILYRLAGDDGANVITGAQFDDTLIGGAGNDTLVGGELVDGPTAGFVEPETGDDTFIGGPGADLMQGATGTDTVDYSDAPTSVFIDMDFDGVARGFRGEAQGDVLEDIEVVLGSGFEDILIGSSRPERLDGGDGNDRVMGSGYNDTLAGGDGDDLIAATDDAPGRFTQLNNAYLGGEGHDVVALETFAPHTATGNVSATATYSYLTGSTFSSSTETDRKAVTVAYAYERTGHVKVRLEDDGTGLVEYWQDDASSSVRATGLSGTAAYSIAEKRSVADVFPPYTIETTTFDYAIDKSLSSVANDSITFSKSGANNNGSGRITTTPSAPSSASGGHYDTETVSGIEGVIGTIGNDTLVGNAQANALYGNGGIDRILGGSDGNLIGFGEGQAIRDIFSFPGATWASGSGSGRQTLAQVLSEFDPYGTMDGREITPLGEVSAISGGDDVGSFLWGQGQDNTLDMRHDRGLTFFPDRSTNTAKVDLDIAGSAVTNAFTGEATMYGKAEIFDAGGTRLNNATTFGIHNVIGSQNDDTITGDRADNVIEGMDGADTMSGGEGGVDTLAYGRAPEGVGLLLQGAGTGLAVIGQSGHADGDRATDFDRLVLSAHDDSLDARVAASDLPDGAALPLADRPLMRVEAGAGPDTLLLGLGARVDASLGAGADRITVTGPGHAVSGDDGQDIFTLTDAPPVLVAGETEADRTTRIDGGAGLDTVVLDGDGFTRLERTAEGVRIVQEAGAGSQPFVHELQGIEFLEVDGARMRLEEADPITGGDLTLTLREDARAQFEMDFRATGPELEAGTVFRVEDLPAGAEVLGPDGLKLSPGDTFTADEIAALRALPGQGYGQASERFVFSEVGGEDEPRVVPLPPIPPVEGAPLGLDAPHDPGGGPLVVTVTEVPGAGTVFLREPDTALAEMGLLRMAERPLSVGDTLTPEEVARLFYRGEANATGPAGAFAYTADHGEGLRPVGSLQSAGVSAGLDAERFDGVASQRVGIEFFAVDDAPTVTRLLFPMSPGGTLNGQVAASDPEGDAFTLEIVDAPTLGTIDLGPGGGFTYRQTAPVDFGEEGFVEDVFGVRAVQSGSGLASVAREQTVRIVDPATTTPIAFDARRPDVFFEDDGTPVKLGGLGTDDMILGAAGIANELFGFGGDDVIRGLGGANRMTGGDGDDRIEGGAEADTALYSGPRSAYTVTLSPDGVSISDRRESGDGTDALVSVETLEFDAELWPLAIFDGVAGLAEDAFRDLVEMYIAYFDRAPDAEGLFFWGTTFAGGLTLEQIAADFLTQPETRATYPEGLSNDAFAREVYDNVLGRAPDPLGFDFWVGLLDAGDVGRDIFILEVLRGAKAPAPDGASPAFRDQKAADMAFLADKADLGIYFAVTKGMSDVDDARAAMGRFDGTEPGLDAAKSVIEAAFADAVAAEDGAFLLPLVGVIDDPFAL